MTKFLKTIKDSRQCLSEWALPLQQENVMAFRVVKHGSFLLALNKTLLSNCADSGSGGKVQGCLTPRPAAFTFLSLPDHVQILEVKH
jgi:hypothetical protein